MLFENKETEFLNFIALLRGSNQLYVKQTLMSCVDVFGDDTIVAYFVEMLVYGDYGLKVIGLDGLEEMIEGVCKDMNEAGDLKVKISNALNGWSKPENSLDEKIKAHLIKLLS